MWYVMLRGYSLVTLSTNTVTVSVIITLISAEIYRFIEIRKSMCTSSEAFKLIINLDKNKIIVCLSQLDKKINIDKKRK